MSDSSQTLQDPSTLNKPNTSNSYGMDGCVGGCVCIVGSILGMMCVNVCRVGHILRIIICVKYRICSVVPFDSHPNSLAIA